MTHQRILKFIFILVAALLIGNAHADTQADLGLKEIRAGMRGARPIWSKEAFFNLSKVWGTSLEPKSSEFKHEIQKRYGLYFDKGFANDELPVGLTQTSAMVLENGSYKSGITISCQACHSSSLLGTPTDSISNVFFDFARFYSDMQISAGDPKQPFFESNPARNSMVSYSNYMGRLGIFVRNPFPFVNLFRLYAVFADPNADNSIVQPLKKELPLRELVKTQSWIDYQYKIASGSGLYVDGGYHGSPSAAHYALHFTWDPYGSDFALAVQSFDRVGPDYLKSLSAPRSPWLKELNPIAVSHGAQVYSLKCASCHGTYTQDSVTKNFNLDQYTGELIDRAIVQTDPLRIDYPIHFDDEAPEWVQKTYTKTHQYIAPPLNGIWARAPYLHNASVPTLMQLLDSKKRMKRFGIHPDPDSLDNYDSVNVGWVTLDLSNSTPQELEELKKRDPYLRIYNPDDHIGMTNSGHFSGDWLSVKERLDLLEFLKAI